MRSATRPASPDYGSPQWVQGIGLIIERVGLWPAIALCTLVSEALTLLTTLSIALVLMPQSLLRPLLVAAFVPLIVTPVMSFGVFRLIQDLTLTRQALRQIADHDVLTQAHTRRFFMNSVIAPAPASVHPVPESIVLLDIDDFKSINDRHGHQFGDRVLQAVSEACRRQLRSNDLFARFGGEEFVILLADVRPEVARSVTERIRRAVAELDIPDAAGQRVAVTVSMGVAHRDDRVRGAGAALLEQAIGLADKALYAAKRNGKNRFEFVTFTAPSAVAA